MQKNTSLIKIDLYKISYPLIPSFCKVQLAFILASGYSCHNGMHDTWIISFSSNFIALELNFLLYSVCFDIKWFSEK